jgi:hypothetical protein
VLRGHRRTVPPAAVAGVLVVVVAVVAAAIGLAVGGTGRDVARAVGLNLLTAATLTLLGWLYLSWWVSRRATRELLELARRAPDELLAAQHIPHPVHVIGRDRLIRQLATDLSRTFRATPQIVVGETGSGKTSLLLGLAQHLAERGVVPVGISLRGTRDPNLAGLARDRFLEAVDPHTRSTAEAERVWRLLCQRGAIAILADDLDRARFSDESESGALRALEAARDHGIALVVTSRRSGVPRELERAAIELDALQVDDEAATAYVLQRAGRSRRNAPTAEVHRLVREGVLRESPFYLGIAADLLADHTLPQPVDGRLHATRVALLDAWIDGLLIGELVPDGRVPPRARASTLTTLEALAALRLVPDAAALEREGGLQQPADETAALDVGERLGLTEWLGRGDFRFTHQVLHAYLAARLLRSRPEVRRAVLALAPDAPIAQLALVLASVGAEEQTVRETAAALLERAPDVSADARLLSAVAAAEVAAAAGVRALEPAIARACAEPRVEASLLTKLAAVRWLGALAPEAAAEALWDYAGDEEYAVRWAVAALWAPSGETAQERAAAGARAMRTYATLHERFQRNLQDADELVVRGEAPVDDWHPVVAPLKQLAWVLPALRTSARHAGDREREQALDAALRRVLGLEGTLTPDGVPAPDDAQRITEQRGLEASIAQGFKADALRHPEEPVDPLAEALLTSARFWYSRVNLVHALALRAPAEDSEERQRVCRTLRWHARRDPHPFVRATARLALRGVRERLPSDSAGNRYVWDDEGVVVGSRPEQLELEVSQLVGDVAVLLNMNEAGDRSSRDYFGNDHTPPLPVCFGRSHDRAELFGGRGGCPDDCAFQLCPYRVVSGRKTAHRAISRAFCRHQQRFARTRYARRWGAWISRRRLRELWRALEARAKV